MTAPDLDALERRHRLVSHLHEWRVDGGQIWARDYSGCVGVSWRRIGEIRDPDVRDFLLHAADDIATLIARLREAERQRDEARAALREAQTPDLWWSQADGLSPEETCLEHWRDECSNAGPGIICPVSAGKTLGTKWTVMLPTNGEGSWLDDCRIFDTEAEAEAALSALPPPAGSETGER